MKSMLRLEARLVALALGVVPASSASVAWPESFRKAWRVEIGEGYSPPVVSTGRVFVHSRLDPDELVTVIDLVGGLVAVQVGSDVHGGQIIALDPVTNRCRVRDNNPPGANPNL